MSFLDNLENNLKAMESLEPGGLDDRKRREADRERALAVAPWAERLKTGPFVAALMRDLTRAGHLRRMKMNFTWLGTTLRIEARGLRLELEPTPEGVDAVFADRRVALNLDATPDSLVQEWLGTLDKKAAAEAAEADDVEDE